MKILHVINSLEMGGAEKLLTELVPVLKCAVSIVDVCVFDPTPTPFMENLQHSGISIIPLGSKTKPYNPKHIPALRSLMKKYDIIHTHGTPAQYMCVLASIGIKGKLITTEHSTNNRRRSKRWMKPMEKLMYGRYSSIIGCSEMASEALKEYLPKLSNRILPISNGISISRYADARSGKTLPPRGPNEIRLIMTGRFHYPKNQSFLIQALDKLEKRIHLYFVGEGVTMEDCKALVKELSVENRVHFLGLRTDIPELLKSVDIMTHVSFWEGLPVSILEGMAAGLPIIASDSPGIREIVNNIGLLFDKGSVDDFVQKLEKVISNEALYQKMTEASREAVKNYSIEQMASSYLKVYESVITYSTIIL